MHLWRCVVSLQPLQHPRTIKSMVRLLPELHAAHVATDTSSARQPHRDPLHGSLPLLAKPISQRSKESSRKRRPEFDDMVKHPIDRVIQDIRSVTGQIKQSFARMNQTEELFERELAETQAWVQQLKEEQQQIAHAYVQFFHYNAVQIQRMFRGYLARCAVREVLVLKVTLRIQRGFRRMQVLRAERRRRFRVMLKKLLRGLKAVNARHELSHNELLNRVSHNMMIERQWRMAMGIAGTESNLINALYRRKFVRKQLATKIHEVVMMNSIVCYWKSLVPVKNLDEEQHATTESELSQDPVVCDVTLDLKDVVITTREEETEEPSTTKTSLFVVTQQLSGRAKGVKYAGRRQPPVAREDLRRKQKLYTQKLYEENMKKEAARIAQLEKQREAARLAEEARKQMEEEQRKLRLEQAQALKEDLERRGLLAIKELQAKKEDELRKEEIVRKRIAEAKQRITKQVLSDETQTLLTRKLRQPTKR